MAGLSLTLSDLASLEVAAVVLAKRRNFHHRGNIPITPTATPNTKTLKTTTINGARQEAPKKKFTKMSSWLLRANANRVKKNGCFQCPLKQPHEVFQNNSSVTEKNFSPEHWFNF